MDIKKKKIIAISIGATILVISLMIVAIYSLNKNHNLVSENSISNNISSNSSISKDSISDNDAVNNGESATVITNNTESSNSIKEDSISEDSISEDSISEDSLSDDSISEDSLSDNSSTATSPSNNSANEENNKENNKESKDDKSKNNLAESTSQNSSSSNKVSETKTEVKAENTENKTEAKTDQTTETKTEIKNEIKTEAVKYNTYTNKYNNIINADARLTDNPRFALYVNKSLNTVTAYTIDANGNEIPFKAMLCSCGREGHTTPSGTFKTSNYYEWRLMVDNTYGKYAVRFNNKILFHSVPYIEASGNTLEWDQFNLLGSNASLGCVRMAVADVKWIYDNCRKGTKVVVYSDSSTPGPLGKPEPIRIPIESPNRDWDPTDPDPMNPWNN